MRDACVTLPRSLWLQGDGLDHIVKAVYPAVFFFWYSNRGVTVEQTSFQQYVRNQSASKFDYHYAADDEVGVYMQVHI